MAAPKKEVGKSSAVKCADSIKSVWFWEKMCHAVSPANSHIDFRPESISGKLFKIEVHSFVVVVYLQDEVLAEIFLPLQTFY